jgi:hypothetical protein
MSVINFLIYCNGVTWFHKSIDATGKYQDAKFLFKVASKLVHFTIDSLSMCSMITKICAFFQEIRKFMDDIGPEHIVHIVTDNGANYKNMVDLMKLQFWTRMMMTVTSLSRPILSGIT